MGVVIEPDLLQGEPGPQGPQGDPGPQGPQGDPGPAGGTYLHTQNSPSATWSITHNLGFFPNVTAIDSAGSEVEGDVAHIDDMSLTISFSVAFGGTATLS